MGDDDKDFGSIINKAMESPGCIIALLFLAMVLYFLVRSSKVFFP